MFTTLWRMSETVKFVFIASSVCKWMVNNGHTIAVTERTSKTWRILLRSNLQVAIVSLSFFAWNARETAFRLPRRSTMFFWISAKAL